MIWKLLFGFISCELMRARWFYSSKRAGLGKILAAS